MDELLESSETNVCYIDAEILESTEGEEEVVLE